MASKFTSTINIQAMLTAAQGIHNAAVNAIQQQGQAVENQSIANCPVDTGNLEKSHQMTTEETSSGVMVTVSAGDDQTSDYALFAHESEYTPGPLSQAKAQINGQTVGRKFLERAFDEQVSHIVPAIREAITNALEGKPGSVSNPDIGEGE